MHQTKDNPVPLALNLALAPDFARCDSAGEGGLDQRTGRGQGQAATLVTSGSRSRSKKSFRLMQMAGIPGYQGKFSRCG